MDVRKPAVRRRPAAGAFFLFTYLIDLAYLPYLLIFLELGNLVVLHRVACLRQPRKLLLSPRAIRLSLSLGPGKHIAAQAPSFRALNCGVGAQRTNQTPTCRLKRRTSRRLKHQTAALIKTPACISNAPGCE
jgi:hypothetical protein